MKTKRFILIMTAPALLLAVSPALAADEAYGPFNVDGGHITCKSFSGDEIKKTQTFRTTEDRFFKEDTAVVRMISGWAPKSHSCSISAIRRALIPVTTEAGIINVSVIKEFDVYAAADCGTDSAKFAGMTASIECEASATVVKYSHR